MLDNSKFNSTQPQALYNQYAEEAIIGALLNNNHYIHEIADFLLPTHFYLRVHQEIYQLVLKFVDNSMVADPNTLKNYIDKPELFKHLKVQDSFQYLYELAVKARIITDITSVARSIYDLYIRRCLIALGEDTINNAYVENPDLSYSDRIELLESKLFNLSQEGAIQGSLYHVKKILDGTQKKISQAKNKGHHITGVKTSYTEMDRLLSGLQPSDLIIIAARPSMGKTSFAINIAINASDKFANDQEDSKSVVIFSLEMSAEQVATRMLSIKTKISSHKIRGGEFLAKDEFARLSDNLKKLAQLPVWIDDSAALTISALRTRARRMKRQNNLGLIVIDYLQLIRASDSSRGYHSRVHEISEISQGLKAIAKELDVPVIALSQLSRAVESREDKRPQLSDLRESGSIEQDADVVMFIYREEYYLERQMRQAPEKLLEWQEKQNKCKNIAEISVAKQRNGPIGHFQLRFDADTTSFDNLDIAHQY